MLFDFGGVLTESPFEAFARYEAEAGLPAGFVRGLNATSHHTNAWARLERGEVGFEEFCDLFEAEARAAGGALDARDVMRRVVGGIRPGMIDVVARCRTRHKTGLLTNNWMPVEGGTGPATVLDDLFDAVVESSRVGVRKPEPRFYEIACEMLDVTPPEAVFLDDLGVNLKPAREMGMTTIKVADPGAAVAELARVLGMDMALRPEERT